VQASIRRSIDEAKKAAPGRILAIVEQESHHGYEIAKLIEQRTGGSLRFARLLYATLYRLEDRG
jgi:DNA-binding PadR family transcriptional regulator